MCETPEQRKARMERQRECFLADCAFLVQKSTEMLSLCSEDPDFAQARREQIEGLLEIMPEYGLGEYVDEMKFLLSQVIGEGVRSGAWPADPPDSI